MTGFLNGKNARQFMDELWALLLSAQDSDTGIPSEFIEEKKEEILKREREKFSLDLTEKMEVDNMREIDKIRLERNAENILNKENSKEIKPEKEEIINKESIESLKDRGKSREKSKERERSKDRGKSIEKSRGRGRSRDKTKDREINNKSNDRSRDRNNKRNDRRSRSRNRNVRRRSRSRDQRRDSRDKRKRSKSRSKSKQRERSKSRSKIRKTDVKISKSRSPPPKKIADQKKSEFNGDKSADSSVKPGLSKLQAKLMNMAGGQAISNKSKSRSPSIVAVVRGRSKSRSVSK